MTGYLDMGVSRVEPGAFIDNWTIQFRCVLAHEAAGYFSGTGK